jgi:hypothetical protein
MGLKTVTNSKQLVGGADPARDLPRITRWGRGADFQARQRVANVAAKKFGWSPALSCRAANYRWGSINAVNCDFDMAPVRVATTSPPLKTIKVGMARTP